MIDYHGDVAALGEFLDALNGAFFADQRLANAQREAVHATGENRDAALLGAWSGHLFVHAASDGAEIELLDRAAVLWSRGTALCDELATVRADLEHAMENPAAAGAAAVFNDATVRAQGLAYDINALRPEIDALREAALAFLHLPPHPRQEDEPTERWDWGNLVHARRTDALARNLLDRANGSQELAFALGAVAAYGANSSGSAYLGHVVGGPRRSHRHRDRLARNTVGAWLAAHHPATRPLNVLAGSLPATLPAALRQQLTDALSTTFDVTATRPVPDLDAGYTRMLHHLDLLTRFAPPTVPTPPADLWLETLYADPSRPPPSLRPQDVDIVGQDGGGTAVHYGSGPGPGSQQPGTDDSSKANAVCGIIALIILLIDVLQALVQCLVQAADEETCTFWDNMLLSKLWEQDPPDPRDSANPQDPDVTAQGLTTMSSSPRAAQLVSLLFDAHNMAWEAMDRAYNFLASTGLILPDGLLALPLYAQFTALPAHRERWPRRPEPEPVQTYHRPPASSEEHPVVPPSPFDVGAAPDVFLGQATTTALTLWAQQVSGQSGAGNLDLDADRGAGHLCWRARGSITDDPVDVETLAYEEQS